MSGEMLFQQSFTVCGYDSDFFGNCRAAALHNSLINAAITHAEAIGLDRDNTHIKTGGIWMLVRMAAFLHRPLRYGDSYTIATWPRGAQGPYLYRDFEITDGKNIIGGGVSAWVVVRLDDGGLIRPKDAPELMKQLDTGKPDMGLLSKLTPAASLREAGHYSVDYSVLDINGHVNNVRYLEMASDALALHSGNPSFVKSYQINYLAQCLPGENIELYKGETGDGRVYVAGRAGGKTRFDSVFEVAGCEPAPGVFTDINMR